MNKTTGSIMGSDVAYLWSDGNYRTTPELVSSMKVQFYTPPPFKVCPDCGGYGVIKRVNQGYGKSSTRKCPTCHGTGRIPIWYTVEQWEEFTGRKVPDDMPVFAFWDFAHDWLLRFYSYSIEEDREIVIVATEAGRPPKNWRPE